MPKLPKDWKTSEYGTHWRLLTALFDTYRIESVLETGSGLYSTRLFLDHFKVRRLVSLENNPEWFTKGSKRHEFIPVEGAIADRVPNLDSFDLVFVDDDPVDERVDTIHRVIELGPRMVVVHDTDYREFWDAVRPHPHYTDRYHEPHTSVIWPNAALDKRLPA